jgi:hypothetical protein
LALPTTSHVSHIRHMRIALQPRVGVWCFHALFSADVWHTAQPLSHTGPPHVVGCSVLGVQMGRWASVRSGAAPHPTGGRKCADVQVCRCAGVQVC